MPIPKPKSGETRDAFAARCIPTQVSEGKDAAQAAAICFSTFDRSKEAFGKDHDYEEELPAALNCDPINVAAGDVGAGGAVLLHAWAHSLWTGGLRTEAVLEMHEDARQAGEAAGVPHEDCDGLDEAAAEQVAGDPGPDQESR